MVRKMGGMEAYQQENLCHDPIHGYIPFVAPNGTSEREICERQIIDGVWVQRMRQIRQLQTAWWVFPTAEHSRFQHILGVMHLASVAVEQLYESLKTVDSSLPSRPLVDSTMRMAGLLHDVGHGPFGHFFDSHYLARFGLTHEVLGAHIIELELGDSLRGLRRSPAGEFLPGEQVDPIQVAWLIQRPKSTDQECEQPRWLQMLRSLFCGIYTIDNMDFVLRDAYMTGFSPRSFDLRRVLHYSQFTETGLTLHERGMPALVHFLAMKAELFRNVYFHRTVRAIDLHLTELFRESFDYLFPGDPREHLAEYLDFTEFSLLSEVKSWKKSKKSKLLELGKLWESWLQRRVPWVMVCQRNVSFSAGQAEASSVFSSSQVLRASIQEKLTGELADIEFEVDLARHMHRPNTHGATAGMNFYFDSSTGSVRDLDAHGLYEQLPVSHTIARIYTRQGEHRGPLSNVLDQLLGSACEDDLTNM